MAGLTFYGLRNCDSCRRARRWLDDHGIAYRYHDVGEDGLQVEIVQAWLGTYDWQTVVNRRSTTWRGLPADVRDAMDTASAAGAIAEHPTLAKRPILVAGEFVEIGFSAERYQKRLGGRISRSGR